MLFKMKNNIEIIDKKKVYLVLQLNFILFQQTFIEINHFSIIV